MLGIFPHNGLHHTQRQNSPTVVCNIRPCKTSIPHSTFWDRGHKHSIQPHRESSNFQRPGHSLYLNCVVTIAITSCSRTGKLFWLAINKDAYGNSVNESHYSLYISRWPVTCKLYVGPLVTALALWAGTFAWALLRVEKGIWRNILGCHVIFWLNRLCLLCGCFPLWYVAVPVSRSIALGCLSILFVNSDASKQAHICICMDPDGAITSLAPLRGLHTSNALCLPLSFYFSQACNDQGHLVDGVAHIGHKNMVRTWKM